jgi:arylsulfatase A-like enzyme
MPTVLDLVGAPIPSTVQGRSLRPMLEGKGGATETLSGHTFIQDAEVRSPATLRTSKWSYLYGGDEAPSELYDLAADPDEQRNLLSERRDQAERLHARYLKFLERIACPREYLDGRREFDPKPRKGLPRHRRI